MAPIFALPLPLAVMGALFYVGAWLIAIAITLLLSPLVLLAAVIVYLRERRRSNIAS